MLEQGTMRPIKKILGLILIVAGLIFVFASNSSYNSYIGLLFKYRAVFGLVILLAGYLLFIVGRQS